MHTFPGAGRYTVPVWVNDSVGAFSHQIETYAVGSTSSSAGPAGAPNWFWAALATLIAAGAVGAFGLLSRRRAPPKS